MAGQFAPEAAHLNAQPLLRGFHLTKAPRVADGHGDTGGQRLEQGEVGLTKRLATAAIDGLKNPEAAFISDQRSRNEGSGDDRARGHSGLLVDARKESSVGTHVIDLLRVSAA